MNLVLWTITCFLLTMNIGESMAETLIINEDFQSTKLGLDSHYLIDSDRHLKVKDVWSEFQAGRTLQMPEKRGTFGFTSSAVWMIVRIDQTTSLNKDVFLYNHYPSIDHIEYWLMSPDGEILQEKRVGDRLVLDETTVRHRFATVDLSIPSGRTYLLARITSKGSVVFASTMMDPKSFYREAKRDYIIGFSLISMLAVMGVYNLCLYIQLRTITYVFYAGFIASMIILTLVQTGLIIVFTDNIKFHMNMGQLIYAGISTFFAFLLTYYLLGLRKRKILRYANLIGITLVPFGLVLLFLHERIGGVFIVLNGMYLTFFALSAGSIRSVERFRPAYFFTMAWLAFLLALLYRNLALMGVLPLGEFGQWGVPIGNVIETTLISLALADKVRLREKESFERIQSLNQGLEKESFKVKELNEHLEEMVESQTREIKSIMANIELGIIVIKDENLIISDTFSESTKGILETQTLAGLPALDVLFSNLNIGSELRDQAHSVLLSTINGDSINFEANQHCLPEEIIFQFENTNKVLQFGWTPIINSDELVEKIIVSIRDATRIKQLELEASKGQEELRFIAEVIAVSPKQFSRFIVSSLNFIRDNIRLLSLDHQLEDSSIKIVFINLHTIKGSARTLGFQQLTPRVHEVEQLISDSDVNLGNDFRNTLLHHHHLLEKLLLRYETINNEKLGRKTDDAVGISHSLAERIHQVNTAVVDAIPSQYRLAMRDINHEIESIIFTPAEQVINELFSDTKRLARDLDKEEPELSFEGGGYLLSEEGQNIIRSAMVHVIRNSMDHGIEKADVRRRLGKNSKGKIRICLSTEANTRNLVIVYSDDGAGLNVERLLALAGQNNRVPNDGDDIDLEEIAESIFFSGISTAERVSEISGRGVGMAAVRQYFQTHGGAAFVRLGTSAVEPILTKQGFVPFELILTLPEKYYILTEQKKVA
ncbi:MAG: Hpt domain-containing protein [Pseudobacteriovorax sp.]|nr:Hpt domain-containing protein [Pseudobacteriovorax sp.]